MADIAFPQGRVVADGVTTNTDATVTSATAAFVASDVGAAISGTGIPALTTIAAVNSSTSIELSAAATASGTGITLTIALSNDQQHTEAGRTWYHDTSINAWLVLADASSVLTTADIVDEDAMTSNSATLVPSQQSVKAYVDNEVAASGVTTINGASGVVVLDADDIDDTATTNKFATAAELTAIAAALPKVAAGASVEDIGAVESNVQTVATSGATETLDTSVYGVFDVTMDQACTFTFSNPAPSGKATIFTLILRGAFTPTWPASVDWPDATAPTYTTPTVYTFMSVDAGTTWLGASAGKAFG